jgi:hypothetical protein
MSVLQSRTNGHILTLKALFWRSAEKVRTMPYELKLPPKVSGQHWKVKIFDKELLYEEPHVTILFKTTKWRWGLRSRDFLDAQPHPGEVPQQVLTAIREKHDELCRQWDERFPTNPVHPSAEDGDNYE